MFQLHAVSSDGTMAVFKPGSTAEWRSQNGQEAPPKPASEYPAYALPGDETLVREVNFTEKPALLKAFEAAHGRHRDIRWHAVLPTYPDCPDTCKKDHGPYSTLYTKVVKRLQKKDNGTAELLRALVPKSEAADRVNAAKCDKSKYMPPGCCASCFERPKRCIEAIDDFQPALFTFPNDGCPCAAYRQRSVSVCDKLFQALRAPHVSYDEFESDLRRVPPETRAAHINCFRPAEGIVKGTEGITLITLLHAAFMFKQGDECYKFVRLLLREGADKEAVALGHNGQWKGHKPIWAAFEGNVVGYDRVEACKLLLDKIELERIADEAEKRTEDKLSSLSAEVLLKMSDPADLLHTCTKDSAKGSDNSGTPLYVALHLCSDSTSPMNHLLLVQTSAQLAAAERRAREQAKEKDPELWRKLDEHKTQWVAKQRDFLKRLYADELQRTLSTWRRVEEALELETKVVGGRCQYDTGAWNALTQTQRDELGKPSDEYMELTKLERDERAFWKGKKLKCRKEAESRLQNLDDDAPMRAEWNELQQSGPEGKRLHDAWKMHEKPFLAELCHPKLRDEMRTMRLRLLLRGLHTNYLDFECLPDTNRRTDMNLWQPVHPWWRNACDAPVPNLPTPFYVCKFVIELLMLRELERLPLLSRVVKMIDIQKYTREQKEMVGAARNLLKELKELRGDAAEVEAGDTVQDDASEMDESELVECLADDECLAFFEGSGMNDVLQ